jgi:hypothetical protein
VAQQSQAERKQFMNANSTQAGSAKSESQNPRKTVAAFFYGSFIRPEIMALGEFHPTNIQVAKLNGFDITFDPHANVFRSDQHAICGILVYPTHEQLHKLYSRYGVGVFLPEAVIVEIEGNHFLPAMCYMPPGRGNKPPDLDYIQRLVAAAHDHKFPD